MKHVTITGSERIKSRIMKSRILDTFIVKEFLLHFLKITEVLITGLLKLIYCSIPKL